MTKPQPDTLHRPPRALPAGGAQTSRSGSPRRRPSRTPPNTGILTLLFPVVGGVGMLGFALAYGSSTFLYIAGAMIVLLLAFSFGMRWSQKRGVRKRAAADARRYTDYLREQDRELARAGELQRARAGAPVPRARRRSGRSWSRAATSGSAARTTRTSCTCASARARSRWTAASSFDLGVNPLAEHQKGSLREARKLRRPAHEAAQRAGGRRPRRERRAGRHRRTRALARLGTRA